MRVICRFVLSTDPEPPQLRQSIPYLSRRCLWTSWGSRNRTSSFVLDFIFNLVHGVDCSCALGKITADFLRHDAGEDGGGSVQEIRLRVCKPAWKTNWGRLIVGVAVLVAALVPAFGSAQEEGGSSTPVYFEETGQTLSGPFLDAWFLVGGPDRTGLPVSSPVKIGDNWVQWFEYARMEVVSESYTDADPAAVALGAIGSSYAQRFGYSQSHPAFRAVDEAGEDAQFFEETGHSLGNAMLDAHNNGSNADYLGMPISQEFRINGSTYQFFEFGALSWTSENGAERVPVGTLEAMLHGRLGNRVEKPEQAETYSSDFFALRGQYPGERWIEINLSTYTLTAWAGDTPVMSSLVVTGAPVSPTVEGEFRIYWKLPSQTMSGVGADGVRYEQPDVPSVMYFFQDWAIHGAYWRNGFGYAASHGCVNLPLQQGAWIYDWASIGTRVVVHS